MLQARASAGFSVSGVTIHFPIFHGNFAFFYTSSADLGYSPSPKYFEGLVVTKAQFKHVHGEIFEEAFWVLWLLNEEFESNIKISVFNLC